jgi:ERF superfamily
MSLVKIQQELKVPKNQVNAFGKYKYRSAEDIIEAVKPICHKYGFSLQLSDEIVLIGDRIYVKATAEINSKDDSWCAFGYAREEEVKKGMDAAQITGAASSYARKYALNGLFAIDDTKDADATNEHKDEIGEEKRMYLITLLENTHFDDETKQRQAIKISAYTKQEQYDKALKIIQANEIQDKDRIAMGLNYNQSDIKKALK